MKHLWLIIVVFLCGGPALAAGDPCARIVSLAPSITEVLFELGLGDKVVGVTRFCRYPPAAQKIAQIGGLYDVSLENLLTLKATYVFGLKENSEIRTAATRFGVPSLEVNHSTVEGIKASILAIATTCNVQERARERLLHLKEREEKLLQRSVKGKPYRALVVVGRMYEGDALSGVYVSGKDGFYSGVLKLLNLENVNSESTISMPMLSPEGLISLAPDVVIEIVNADDPSKGEGVAGLWNRYPNLPAVRNKRVVVLSEDYASIPGPRYIMVGEEIARRLSVEGAS